MPQNASVLDSQKLQDMTHQLRKGAYNSSVMELEQPKDIAHLLKFRNGIKSISPGITAIIRHDSLPEE